MVKKRIFLLFFVFFLLFFILFLPDVSANFVCGEVESSGDVSPAWFNVRVYYMEDPGNFVTCKVSPSDNKYCCDPQEIEGVEWEIGKTIFAKIFDFGYVAGPVSQIISGEGYDVFPELNLLKVVWIESPNQSIYVGTNDVYVNISSLLGFNNLSYRLERSGEEVDGGDICLDCNNADFYLEDLDFGQYMLEISATNDLGEQVLEKTNFTLLEYLNFGRGIECDGCKENFVPRNAKVRMIIYLNASHNISGRLYDYFPVEWDLIGDEDFEEYSKTHNRIFWDVSGNNIERSYLLRSPNDFLPRRYYFKSQFEDFEGELFEVIIYRFFRLGLLSFSRSFDFVTMDKSAFSDYVQISPSNPLVMDLNNSFLEQIAIFPKGVVGNAKAFVLEKSRNDFENSLFAFTLRTNVGAGEIDRVLIRFKVGKEEAGKFSKISLYKHGDSYIKLEAEKYSEDLEYNYYQAYASNGGIFSIVGEDG